MNSSEAGGLDYRPDLSLAKMANGHGIEIGTGSAQVNSEEANARRKQHGDALEGAVRKRFRPKNPSHGVSR